MPNAYQTVNVLKLIRETLLPLPGTREGNRLGDIGFYIQKKLLCLLKADGETLSLYHHDRDILIAANPDIYYITPHFQNYPYVLVRLPLIADEELIPLLINAWKLKANKTQLKAFEMLTKPGA
ncbi:hypothetical protein MUY27_01110 [Mucilaginibacter sp. RS28]|uniref:MmcQ/YjbR family DNA-binding protein n=1 Tax=Mucilaginibacter straminoryzae TaxID=2932774 RepID=A0A9X1X011_9SPHI|nr:hypothetical protein [Mucilaginibacter straminoryzae]MCJ8208286.1 hypothetical protein [Mucilaginibacter straminoryzae]